MFKPTSPLLGGLLWWVQPMKIKNKHSQGVFITSSTSCASAWVLTILRKIPWRLSKHQKARQRKRLRAVDKVVDAVSAALARNGFNQTKSVDRWYTEMPREQEMLPKDKYTIYDRKEKTYRKGIHSMFFFFSFRFLIVFSIWTPAKRNNSLHVHRGNSRTPG